MTISTNLSVIGFILLIVSSCQILYPNDSDRIKKNSISVHFDDFRAIVSLEKTDRDYYNGRFIIKNLSTDTFYLDTTFSVIQHMDCNTTFPVLIELGKLHPSFGVPQKVSTILPKTELVKNFKVDTCFQKFDFSINVFLSEQKVVEAYHKNSRIDLKNIKFKIWSDVYAMYTSSFGFRIKLERQPHRLTLD